MQLQKINRHCISNGVCSIKYGQEIIEMLTSALQMRSGCSNVAEGCARIMQKNEECWNETQGLKNKKINEIIGLSATSGLQ